MAVQYKWQYYGSLIGCSSREGVRLKLQSWIDGGHPESDCYRHCLRELDDRLGYKGLDGE